MSGHQEYKCTNCGHEWESTVAHDCPRCSELAEPAGSVGQFPWRLNAYGEWMNVTRACLPCDGTGKIHSHNPTCPHCKGTGYYTEWDPRFSPNIQAEQ